MRANVLDLAILVRNESARILKEPIATSLAPQNGATGGTSAHAHLPRVAGVDAMLRGNDVRSREDLVAVSHSLYCGTPVPWSYCFFCELASSVGGAAPMNSSAEVAGVGVTIDGSALGWSWEVTYNAATKEEAEAVVHKQGTTY